MPISQLQLSQLICVSQLEYAKQADVSMLPRDDRWRLSANQDVRIVTVFEFGEPVNATDVSLAWLNIRSSANITD